MKTHVFPAYVLFALFWFAPSVAQSDPCGKHDYSNSEMRSCYSKEALKVNAQIHSLVAKITTDFRRDAKQYSSDGNDVVAQCELSAASKLERFKHRGESIEKSIAARSPTLTRLVQEREQHMQNVNFVLEENDWKN